MEYSLFDIVVDFVSNHFELLVYLNVSLAVFFLVIFAGVWMQFISFRRVALSVFRGVLLTVIVTGQLFFIVTIGYLYWKNYQEPASELQLSSEIVAGTTWVNDDLRVYFINGNTLYSIQINGKNREEVLTADTPIREYYFSPDGRHLLVLTEKDLMLIDRTTAVTQRVDTLGPVYNQPDSQNIAAQGSIGAIQWAPDSRKFVYEVARWSQFATHDLVYIYNLNGPLKQSIKSPTRRISSLYWNKQGDALYYIKHEAKDVSVAATAYEVKVFFIPLKTLIPQFVVSIPYDQFSTPLQNLSARGIDLYLDGSQYSFGSMSQEDFLVSEHGATIGIDENDFMYFVGNQWFRKRLFKIPREASSSDLARYQYRGGDLVVDHIRWVPGGRYVIMGHKFWGVLVLEPSTGKVGVLLQAVGHSFGWYRPEKS